MTQPEILTSSVQVAELARRLETQPVISMDLEADSLHSYRDKVCLIQISLPNETVLIDTLLVKQLDSLRYSMADRRIRKIFHAGDYDLRCLHRDFGLEIKGLFDQIDIILYIIGIYDRYVFNPDALADLLDHNPLFI
ncbi:MAG: ribonuclease D, partial [Deltaproteobacteria bacterium]|nr:ribonuclease D [Deltaproteobacteria bacterium]